ncbi:MAG: flavodoxin, partial [Mailhella sp.]
MITRREMLAALAGFAAAPAFFAGTGAAQAAEGKTLVMYFSMPETDRAEGMTRDEENSTVVVDGKVLGNTQYAAMLIAGYLDADLFRIEPREPYPTDHRTLVTQAEEEKRVDARPEAKAMPEVQTYDTVFIGYPNWWADIPMILYTVLEKIDLSGKRVIPFCTHGGSSLSGT